jgi:hypothetical protein
MAFDIVACNRSPVQRLTPLPPAQVLGTILGVPLGNGKCLPAAAAVALARRVHNQAAAI